ncbi:MAG TPA: urea ABC transporter ATP-binding subunit UrtE [Planctomycetes bacterium]|nr:urea ABC transporter ATP-binding subunit UrtE [Planctomycetota bacterium]
MLSIENLSFAYGNVQVLHNINMAMAPGEVTCIVGRNGVGKTTLMKNIMGTLRASGGDLSLNNVQLRRLPANRRAKAGIALVPQGRQIFPKLTVQENLLVGLQARTNRVKKIPDEIYDMFPILKSMARRMGGDLSGGQQQQLAIGRALVGEPEVLLLDEPTEGIQPNIIQQIGEVLRQLAKERNVIVVLVEQYLDFVHEFGHRFYLMNRGRSVADGATSELTSDLVAAHLSV